MERLYRNVNDAFTGLIESLVDHPHLIRTQSRAGEVLMIPEPVTITYQRPLERVLFNQARDANPFFSLYESLWMLAGRNDVERLAFYNSNIAQFSDDGHIFNGAYGYRWRGADRSEFAHVSAGELLDRVDQLPILVNHLKTHPESRRAVLQMWNVEDDLLKVDTSKDVCCLSGQSKFRSPEGEVSIHELARRFQTRASYKFPVYSVDTISGEQSISWMTNAWKVGVKSVITLEFDDGTAMSLTRDHRLFRRRKLFDGNRCTGVSTEECCAGDLQPGDSVLAANGYKPNSSGYREYKINLFRNTAYSNLGLEHRVYLKLLGQHVPSYRGVSGSTGDGHSVHHKNGNKLDNRSSNIEVLDNYTHFSHDKFGDNNPHNRMSSSAKAARGRKHSLALRQAYANTPQEIRRIMATHKSNRTEEQWNKLQGWQDSKDNHRVVSVTPSGTMVVYDFTVPGRHTAVLNNGVVVHNCNVCCFFSLPEFYPLTGPMPVLDMTVINRSNDMIWGMLGANVVHFSFLQEYLAACLGVQVGVYRQFSNNLHTYTARWEPFVWLKDTTPDAYLPGLTTVPLVQIPKRFDSEVIKFCGFHDPWSRIWQEPFLQDVAAPMCWAYALHRVHGRTDRALECLDKVKADDWRLAGKNWLRRRLKEPK